MKKTINITWKFLVMPFFFFIILSLIGVPEKVIGVLVSIWMGFLYGIVINIMFNFISSRRIKRNKGSVYEWMEDLVDNDENLTFQLKRMNIRYKTFDNLLAIKKIIIKATNNDIEKLRLYKAFYSLTLKESTEELYYKIIVGLLSTGGIFILRDQISNIKDNDFSDSFLTALIIIFSILAFIGIINENKKRSGLMIEILEICIEEIEECNKKKEKYY